MLEVAEIIRLHGAAYLARFADRILPSHRRALRDLEACRTPAMGGHVHQCDHCGRQVYAFHSCRNRHCPKCHRDQTDLAGIEFLQRFLQHVLPRGCTKVRYYGIWSPTCRRQLDQARALLTDSPVSTEPAPLTPTPPSAAADRPPMRCPLCRTGILIRVGVLTPQRMRAP